MKRDEIRRDKIRMNLEEFEIIWKNSKEFERIRKNLEEFGRIFGLSDFLLFRSVSFFLCPCFKFWLKTRSKFHFAGFWFGKGFIGTLLTLRSMIMEQNDAK